MSNFDGLDTPDKVRARWLELAKSAHPDAGGSEEEFVKLKAEYDRALAKALEPKDCPDCQGKGTKMTQRGFHSISFTCPSCGGSGRCP